MHEAPQNLLPGPSKFQIGKSLISRKHIMLDS